MYELKAQRNQKNSIKKIPSDSRSQVRFAYNWNVGIMGFVRMGQWFSCKDSEMYN
jgi:hypothetical protein